MTGMDFLGDGAISDIAQRSELAVAAVLPPLVRIRRGLRYGNAVDLHVNGKRPKGCMAWRRRTPSGAGADLRS